MKVIYAIAALFLLSLQSCEQETVYNPAEVFNDFWTFVDENYIFFEDKSINWDSIYRIYQPLAAQSSNEQQLFEICSNALLALKDGHSSLKSEFASSPIYDFRDGYDIHFSFNVVESNYLSSPAERDGALYFSKIGSIGYVYFETMNRYGSFNNIVSRMVDEGITGLIIDLRDNGGGDSNPVPKILSRYVSERTLLGSYIEKTGPGRRDITEPLPVFANPGNEQVDIPIVVIINRICYSATSYFSAMLSALPNVRLVGQKTGGGAGGNYGYQLINGWIIKVSVSDFLDYNNETIELGVDPDILIENNEDDILSNQDKMLEKAIELLE
mgnify:CR=1 FL=1